MGASALALGIASSLACAAEQTPAGDHALLGARTADTMVILSSIAQPAPLTPQAVADHKSMAAADRGSTKHLPASEPAGANKPPPGSPAVAVTAASGFSEHDGQLARDDFTPTTS